MSAPFPLPVLFTSWGFRTHGDKWETPDELADYAAAAGCPSVAVQLGNEPTTEQPNCTADEAQRLRERGLRVLVWGVSGADYLREELGRLIASPSDWLPQVENDPERDLVLDQAKAGIRSPAIVSTYGGASTPADIEALRGAGVQAVLVEIYSETQTDVDLMLWQGTMYGWDSSELFACLGTYHGELPASYVDASGIGRNFGLYLAEPMSSEQFYAWGDFNQKGPPPEPPEPEEKPMPPVTSDQMRSNVCNDAQAWEQNQSSYTPKARLTVCRRIAQAANDDDKWYAIRDDIVAKLDSVKLPK